ncbi:uncharacterized protein Pyn_02429 [Prunus yedoensis var. nudiflora]|uniref:DUF1664 domain-containing protein n=1 Tax=Prunus yedoensis var. nudiflora TaxID=2094558 RepID=A0A314UD68_PRUYE|nr:uncharacterized protein Pyn_02429 [Prunus yedoensis var. nudiflora]
MSAAILLFCLALCCYWNLEPHTVFADLSWSSTILLKIGKLSDFIGELQSLLNGTGEQSEGDFDAIASQLKGNDSQIGLTPLIMPAATLGALVYGYMWWKGLKFSDLMYVTKRSMTAAVSNLHKHLESVTEAIANTNNHLTQRVQNLDDQLLEQKEISKSILENVGHTKGSIEELYVTVTELQSALTGLVSSASTCIGVGKFGLQARFHFRKAGLKEIAKSLSGTLTKSTDAIVQDDIEGPGMKPRNLLRHTYEMP